MAIGAIGNMSFGRQIVRMPLNPLDKSTVVSLIHKRIVEYKNTIFPGRFEIEAAPDNDFSILVVTSSSWFKETDIGQPDLEIQASSIRVAESIVRDYCNGLLGCNMNDIMPGLFFVPGAYDKKSILKYVDENGLTFIEILAHERTKQKKYYGKLIELADSDWARTNGNPLAISDDARLAAEKLGLNKAWIKDFRAVEMAHCKACGELINPQFPVCKHCKAINNIERAKELNITFAS